MEKVECKTRFMCSPWEEQSVSPEGASVLALCALPSQEAQDWPLGKVHFRSSNGAIGTAILDTGSSITAVSEQFVKKAGLQVIPLVSPMQPVTTAGGDTVSVKGTVELPVTIQLMLEEEGGELVHYDRSFVLKDVRVLSLGDASPRDLYIAYRDWNTPSLGGAASSVLGSLVEMVRLGAKLLDSPRVPGRKEKVETLHFVKETIVAAVQPQAPVATVSLEERIRARINPAHRYCKEANRFVKELLLREKLFGPFVSEECTEVVEFELIGALPRPVSFKAPLSRKAKGEVAAEGLRKWIQENKCEIVGWDQPSYGFVFIVPKPNGKWRITVSPLAVNAATRVDDPDGGYMPDQMVQEAMKSGHNKFANALDLTEAFGTFRLGELAQKLSTFTSPVGKVRFKHGYYGWHSFPSKWQRLMMEKVILPTMDEMPLATLLAWIDDIIAAAMDLDTLVDVTLLIMDKILSFGGRINLEKCNFFVQEFDWCGVEVNLSTQQWRIAAHRVQSLLELPIPKTKEQLLSLLGILRYYYWGVRDQLAQRRRLKKLAALGDLGARVAPSWTAEHTTAMREAIEAVVKGEWALIYDPLRPVYVTTDASGNDGFAVVCYQVNVLTGKHETISFFSKGWADTEMQWTPQVKECYAKRYAVTKVMPSTFPFARVVLLCDNKNLSTFRQSKDLRVVRWLQEIRWTDSLIEEWIPGAWNTIADYGSRAVEYQPNGPMADVFEHYIYALQMGEGEGLATEPAATVVPGHLPMASWTAAIARAQEEASREEQESWNGSGYSRVKLAGKTLVLFKNRLVVPKASVDIKSALLKLAHDDDCHLAGSGRTLQALYRHARVMWVGISEDVVQYVNSCYRCQFAKAPAHKPAATGSLSPTLPPYLHHTWYLDLKGPMPDGSGYVVCVVEGLSRWIKLRYVSSNSTAKIREELRDVFVSFGTRPVVLRTDGGAPFNSSEFSEWCKEQGIQHVKGVANHSQGQGFVETRFKSLASAIIAVLGHKAPQMWHKGRLLQNIEEAFNRANVEPAGGCPYWLATGREPRTPLSVLTEIENEAALSAEDVNDLIREHHARLNAVQGRVQLATSLAQAITKKAWDDAHKPGDIKLGDWVLLFVPAANRLRPYFEGPYKVDSVTEDGNFVTGRHFLAEADDIKGPWHVSYVLKFDFSRATAQELTSYQLDADSGVVDQVLDHRRLVDGTHEFHIKWFGSDLTSWLSGTGLKKVKKVIEYCLAAGIPLPGKEPKVKIKVKAVAAAHEVQRHSPRAASFKEKV